MPIQGTSARPAAEAACIGTSRSLSPRHFDIGSLPLDKFIDMPPYVHDWQFEQADALSVDATHLKLTADGFPITCFGIIACRS